MQSFHRNAALLRFGQAQERVLDVYMVGSGKYWEGLSQDASGPSISEAVSRALVRLRVHSGPSGGLNGLGNGKVFLPKSVH